MELAQAMQERHSVRAYTGQPLAEDTAQALRAVIDECNRESGLHIQLVCNEPKAFDSSMAHYGHFRGVSDYIAVIGKKQPSLEETCGYYGEKIVLAAQTMGLNTCWVALTFKKIPDAYTILPGEKLVVVIAVGYGATQGVPHPSKPAETLGSYTGSEPDWYKNGVQAACLAPTAVNQQKFRFAFADGKVTAKAGVGFYTKVDLGIAKYHFAVGSGKGIDVFA